MPGTVFGFEHGASRRYAEAMGRLFGMAEVDAPLPPGFVIELDRPEWSFLKRERLWFSDLFVAAVAATREGVGISNRANSGMVTVITHLLNVDPVNLAQISQPASPAVPTNYVTTGFAQVRDSRVTNMVTQTLLRNTVAGQLRASRWILPPNVLLKLPIVIGPDASVTVEATADNIPVHVCFAGYERPVTPDELAV